MLHVRVAPAARRAFFVLFVLFLAACSGGAGCGGCGGAIPGGFPKPSVIDNAASVRITRSGLDQIGAISPKVLTSLLKTDGTLSFDIPKTDASTTLFDLGFFSVGATIHICPAGPDHGANPPKCVADVKISDSQMHLDGAVQHNLDLSGTIPLRVQDLPITIDATYSYDVGVASGSGNIASFSIDMGVGQAIGGNACNGDVPNFDYFAFPITAVLPIINEPTSPRDGYAMIDAKNAVVNPTLDKSNVGICGSCFLDSFNPLCSFDVGCNCKANPHICCDDVYNFIKDQAFGALTGQLSSAVSGLIASQTCMKSNPTLSPACPTGTNDVSGTCRFGTTPSSACVPIELGFESNINLSSALASISPGTTGGLEMALAGSGDLQVTAPDGSAGLPADNTPYQGHTPNGVTLAMLGGALPQPQSSCVPAFTNAPPTGIPIPDELLKDGITGWPTGDPLKGPNVDIAIAGRFLNYAFGSIYNSGLLCLGITTDQIAQLQSGLLSVLIPSIKTLTFEQKGASVAITTRPQVPPKVTLGSGKDVNTDPLLKIQLDKFAVDFYIWSDDRYVRAFTFTGDLTVPINLSTAKDATTNPNGGLLPQLGTLAIANATVTNSELLTDDPTSVAASLSSIIGGLGGQLVGALKPIDLSTATSSLGLYLQIPDGSIRKLTKGSDDFLGIFANVSDTPVATLEPITEVKIVDKIVHPEAMGLATASRDKLPELHVQFSSPQDDGTRAIEYQWSIDQGTRSAWSQERELTIKTDYLLFQGNHTLNVWSRIVGDPTSQNPTPATAPFRIDTLAPYVKIDDKADGLHVDAWDIVSQPANLVARTRYTKKGQTGEFGEWAALSSIEKINAPSDATSVDVEVKDEEGNIGQVSSALIRGRADSSLSAAGSGCGCSTPGTNHTSDAPFALLALGGFFAFGLRRRGSKKVETRAMRVAPNKAALLGIGSIAVIAATSQGCSCADSNGVDTKGCGADCKQQCAPALEMGMVGAYTSVAKASDGTIWVAGYNDALLSTDANYLYGDLVVGKYDSGGNQVKWQTVDGLPPPRTDGTCPDNDPTGWRGGETDSGDDVGLWTSIQVNGNNRPMVSYYDATNHALKFAGAFDNDNFGVYTLAGAVDGGQPPEPGMDAGRYSKMAVVNGNPVVVYSVNEASADGHLRSKVVLATANTATPKDATAWTFQDIYVDETGPCNALTCNAGQTCIKETGQCMGTVGGCTPSDCGGSGKACVTINGAATCGTVIDSSTITSYPSSASDYISIAQGPNGLGVVAYDRIHGNLLGISNTGGAWAAQILDGETGSRAGGNAVDTGDDGVGASLTITPSGDWHVSYVNGITESLMYMIVPGGTKPLTPEVIDNGQSLGAGQPAFPDGTHIVGDDSRIEVDGSGNITVYYQDATVGDLRVATGTQNGNSHTWAIKSVPQPNKFAGFFPQVVPGSGQITNWWRATDPATKNITGDVSFLTP